MLQSLLSICTELINDISKQRHNVLEQNFYEITPVWGLASSMIIRCEYLGEKIKLRDLLRYLRNSLCHPTSEINLNHKYPSTGYTTIKSDNRTVSTFCFINSPDVRHGNVKKYPNEDEARRPFNDILSNEKIKKDTYVKEITIQRNNPQFQIWSISKQQSGARILRIDIPLENLKKLVQCLSTYLAHPVS